MPVAPPLQPDPTHRYTVDEVLSWPPDAHRYEVVHGELLVTPAPAKRHQVVLMRLGLELGKYLERAGITTDALFNVPVDYFHGDDVYVQPDAVVTYPEELSGSSWRTMKRLRLAVEVLSPSSRRGDRLVKRRAYQDAGVETYWVVDPDAAFVEVWHPEDEVAAIATRELVWRVMPEAAELRIDLASLFAGLP